MPKYGDLGSKFSKTNGKFEISTFKKVTSEISLRLESSYFLAQNAQI